MTRSRCADSSITLTQFALAYDRDRKSKQVSKQPRNQSWKGGSASFLCWSSRLLAFELSDCSCRIRGLPKRRSPAVALVTPPGTTVCPNPFLTFTPLTLKQYHQQPGVPQKFGTFTGFGASTGGFTFAS